MDWQEKLLHSVFGGPTAEEAIALLERQEQEDADRRVRVAERTLVHLGQMPLLAAAMAANARPLQEGGGSRPGSRLPSQLVGITALDELWTLIGNWATNVAARLGVEAPAAVKRHADRDVDVDGFRVWDSPTFRVAVVVEVSDWLRARHGDIQGLPFADEFNTNVDSEMRRWLALFPLEVPAQVLPRVCSTCGRLGSVTVIWSGADGHHDDYTVECSHCREVLASSLRAMKYHPEDCPGCVAATTSEEETVREIQTPNHQNGGEDRG